MDVLKQYGYNWWINQLDKDEKRLKDDWWVHADKIVKKYKNKKDASETQYWLNVFWANVGVLKAALYANPPRPMVNRIWSDPDDNAGRVASLMLERALSYDLMKNTCPMDAALKLAVEDWLIPGLGMIWLRYESETNSQTVPGTSISYDVVSNESVAADYVHWRDVVFPSARVSEDVWYIGRKIYMPAKQFKDRFDVRVSDKDESKPRDTDSVLPKNFTDGKICLYELWCKRTNKIYWVSREVPGFIQSKDDFLKLEGFYPCPMPLMATHTTDDYLPRPDYTMIKDQYDQLNELNTRIVILEKALRVVGVYDKKNAEIQRLLSDARENDMIPVEKWAMLSEGGGLKGVVDWFPVEMIVNVLDKLKEQKAEKKVEIYELSGISDIMRGSTNARETLGAQKLKAQYGSVRLQFKQDEIAQFVREALSIKAEIICGHFQDKTIMDLSNIMRTSDAQFAEEALALLRDRRMTDYRIDINEQSLALQDYQQEQESRMQFLTTTGQFLSQAAPMVQAVPGALPHLISMIRWVASGFRGSNEIQGVLDQALQAAQGTPPAGKPGEQPEQDLSPQTEQIKQQGEVQKVMITSQNKLKEIKLTKDLDLRNALIKLEQEQQGKSDLVVLEGAKQTAAGAADHERAIELAETSHENSLEKDQQDGDIQLEVSKLQPAGGNKAKD